MSAGKDWLCLIEEAQRLLDAAPAAPAWLRAVVGDSTALSDLLVPDAPREHRPTDHFYPH